MKKARIVLRSVHRWLDLNEYEGGVDLQVGPWMLHARAIFNPREWDALHAGQHLSGEVYLQAHSAAEPSDGRPGWTREAGVNYTVTGTATGFSGENLTLVLPGGSVRVDLDGHALNARPGELNFEAEG